MTEHQLPPEEELINTLTIWYGSEDIPDDDNELMKQFALIIGLPILSGLIRADTPQELANQIRIGLECAYNLGCSRVETERQERK